MSTDQQPDSLADGKGWDGSRGERKTNPNDPAEPVPPTGAAWTHDEDDECPRCSKGKLKKITNEGYKTIMLCEKCGYDTVATKMDLVKKEKATRTNYRCPQCRTSGNFTWDQQHNENTGHWRLFDLNKGEPHQHPGQADKSKVKCPKCDPLKDSAWMEREKLHDHIKTAHFGFWQVLRLDLVQKTAYFGSF